MGFARSYDTAQTLATLAELSGSVVLRQTPARSPIGPGFGTVCIVGEPTNDRGSAPAETLVETLREITSAAEFDRLYGPVSASIGSATDGFEGNLNAALALPGLAFSRLIVVAPDLAAGSVTFTRSEGGPALVIPAGVIVSDGGAPAKEWITLEAMTFAAGSEEDSVSVRVRPRVSAQGTALAEAVDTIVSTIDDSIDEVSNAAGLSDVNFDTQYADAIALTVGESGLASDIDVLIARRHTAAVRTALIAAANAAALGRRARMCIYSPPIATDNATATGSSGVGVAATGGRNKRLVYAFPGIRTAAPVLSATAFDVTSDIFVAHMASLYRAVEDIGQPTQSAPYVMGLASTLNVAANQAQYLSWKNLGIAAPQALDGVPEICEDVTTFLTAPDNRIAEVRTVDYLANALHNVARPWVKKLATVQNRSNLASEVEAMLSALVSEANPALQEISGYRIDDETGNTPQTRAAGLHVIKVFVQTLYSMRTILFTLEAGVNVNVTAAAA